MNRFYWAGPVSPRENSSKITEFLVLKEKEVQGVSFSIQHVHFISAVSLVPSRASAPMVRESRAPSTFLLESRAPSSATMLEVT